MHGKLKLFYYKGMNVKMLITCLACLIVTGCFSSPCENTVRNEITSPDGKKIATLFERGCGATTPFIQVVMIRENGSKFRGDDPEDFIFTMKGEHPINIKWESANQLVIKRPSNKSDIFKEEKLWKEVNISYPSE
jgi:hypothetical protein